MEAIKAPRKLIEVALPLDDINEAAIREKSIRHGHPAGLHLWWARRPLAVARAVIFAQMVNDPGYERSLGRGVNKEKAQIERERLFALVRKLVRWENTNNETVLAEAREEIRKSWRETCELNRNHPQAAKLFNPEILPAFHDPFAGGGAIPLEAQRLGLESYASDLNPVAVIINKAMIEIPPRFARRPPVGPIPASEKQSKIDLDWSGAKGLAEDVRRYGAWMREEAFKRIGHLYPEVALPKKHGGGNATVIAWIWARTVKSPNPAFAHVDVPLASTFVLSTKAGKEAYVHPIVNGDSYYFEVREGTLPASAKSGTKLARANFRCLVSGSPIDGKFIKAEGQAGRIGARLLAVVAEGKRGRIYVSPTAEIEAVAKRAEVAWKPTLELAKNSRHMTPWAYGLTTFGDLFTPRQLSALTTFSDLLAELQVKVKSDAASTGWTDKGSIGLEKGGTGPTAYAEAIAVMLSFALDKFADLGNSLCGWEPIAQCPRHLFGRQAISMVWDFAEGNPFSGSSGSWDVFVDGIVKAHQKAFESTHPEWVGKATQADAATQTISAGKVISSDPPYYDNVPYADLSDFFYVWMRRGLRSIYPDLFATLAVPKSTELVADPFRHGGDGAAEKFFMEGMTQAMHGIAMQSHAAFPISLYYAFKQSSTSDIGTASTGWETFLEAVLKAGLAIVGTWPMSTENASRMRGQGSNALASSIVIVCRKREASAPTASRRDFLRDLKAELAEAVDVMIGGAEGISPVAPVDLAQAVIGPGMAVFAKYSAVLEADGSPMTVHSALTLINRMLTEGDDDFDGDTQFCLGWFDEQGWAAGEFGKADVLARAKGTSVDSVRNAGVVEAVSGKVRLLKPSEYPADWNPSDDNNTPVWEALHQMSRALRSESESAAGALLARMPERAERIRNLAYRLYTLCERKGWTDEARGYNELITSWQAIEAASHEAGQVGSQTRLDI